jgi:hypothetical protein
MNAAAPARHLHLCDQLVLVLVAAAAAQLPSTADAAAAGFCLQGARSLADGIESSLAAGARAMPPAWPPLAAHDWPLSRPANREQLAGASYRPCHREAPIFRYKTVAGVIYADHDHASDGRYATYRTAFLEQLALAMWLYRDWPDVDLVVDLTGV